MAFKMKGSSYKMGGVKTKDTMAYMKSPMKNTGSYKTILDEETGKEKKVQTTSDDPNATIRTGNDARKSFKEDFNFSDKKIAGMKNVIDGGLKNIYEMKGDGSQRKAAIMDDEIQRKINAGETLTEKETMFQNRALKNVGW
tara:strand:- start:110 stop:532 length:423 start_codon:yes stop_codon:yes gene_type:complete